MEITAARRPHHPDRGHGILIGATACTRWPEAKETEHLERGEKYFHTNPFANKILEKLN